MPTQNLESYFLSVVQKARQSETATSGATSGSQVAAYLAGEPANAAQADRVLDRLVAPSTPAKEPSVVVAPEALPTVNVGKLEALAKAKEPETPPPATSTPPPPPNLDQANEKLASLLGKKQ